MSELEQLIGVYEQLPEEKRAELVRLAVAMLPAPSLPGLRPEVQKAVDRTVAKFGPALDELSK